MKFDMYRQLPGCLLWTADKDRRHLSESTYMDHQKRFLFNYTGQERRFYHIHTWMKEVEPGADKSHAG